MEVWKQTHCPDYFISNIGRVKSAKKGKEKILKPTYTPKGYLSTRFCYNGKLTNSEIVHRLVAIAFVDGKDDKRNCVNHINGIRDDNRAENLEWVSAAENSRNIEPKGSIFKHSHSGRTYWRVAYYTELYKQHKKNFRIMKPEDEDNVYKEAVAYLEKIKQEFPRKYMSMRVNNF